MTQILTGEDINQIVDETFLKLNGLHEFARAIESIILAKLAEGQKAVAWKYLPLPDYEKDCNPILSKKNCIRVGYQQATPLYAHPSAELKSAQDELAALRAEVERLKQVPMRYRRMAFNAQLQDEAKALHEQLAAAQADVTSLHAVVKAVENRLAASQAREQQLRGMLKEYAEYSDVKKLLALDAVIVTESSHCSDERPCIPCFTDNGPCDEKPAAAKEKK